MHSKNYVLRITKEEWFRQVFTIKKYYPGIRRRWESVNVILLARNTEKGDSFVGYGILEKFVRRDLLSEEEKKNCEAEGWLGALIFSELYRFEPPLLIKDTTLGSGRVRGKCFHGYPLTHRQVNSILNMAKQQCNIRKIG